MFYHLVALGRNNQIGLDHKWPWYLRYFPQLTQGHTIIISKKMYEEIGNKYLAKKVMIVSRTTMTLEAAMAETQEEGKVFIIGGLSIFLQTMPMIDGIYMARTEIDLDNRILYPEIPMNMTRRYSNMFPQNPGILIQFYEREWPKN